MALDLEMDIVKSEFGLFVFQWIHIGAQGRSRETKLAKASSVVF
jgi:hypothetical protein